MDAPFAEEYLHDLARLKRTELNNCIRVARECLKARYDLPKNELRTSQYLGIQPVSPVVGAENLDFGKAKGIPKVNGPFLLPSSTPRLLPCRDSNTSLSAARC